LITVEYFDSEPEADGQIASTEGIPTTLAGFPRTSVRARRGREQIVERRQDKESREQEISGRGGKNGGRVKGGGRREST
jgi:hypothetical protein